MEEDARFNLQPPVVLGEVASRVQTATSCAGAPLGGQGKPGNTHRDIQSYEAIQPSAPNRRPGDAQATAILGADGGEPTGRTADQPSFLGKKIMNADLKTRNKAL